MLNKTDFLRYLEAPLHLWADKHDRLEQVSPTKYQLHLIEQGKDIETMAQQQLLELVNQTPGRQELTFQQMVTEPPYQARLDALVHDPAAQVYDIYEIKSGSSVKKEYLYDAAFQQLVAQANFTVRNTYMILINTEYTRLGPVQTRQLFQVVNVNEQIAPLLPDVRTGRESAWQVASQQSADGIEECLKPTTCPCPELCHPGLPEHSIFELPRLHHTKARQLKTQGVVAIRDLPADFPLTDRQKVHVEAVRTGQPHIDRGKIRDALSKLVFPLSFLDYETYNPAIPLYDGYRPYQHIVFQYSLHVFQDIEAGPIHHEYLATGKQEPSRPLLEHLLPRIGGSGSVVVWNKAFEASRNREMAERFPEFALRLEQINDRMFDLMEPFSKGNVVYAEFHGSASIKNVLPVLVDDLNYDGLPIPQGDEAMMAWVELIGGNLTQEEIEQTRDNLLNYCAMDTMAMVKNWQALQRMISAG